MGKNFIPKPQIDSVLTSDEETTYNQYEQPYKPSKPKGKEKAKKKEKSQKQEN